ncbi:type VII secretion protein EccCa [Mycolicibacterium sp. 624]|uniref:type VII secretion protein EccCa n=1 Tax=Mycolicibacterium sp. 624 TaxID=3156314 RepID=UPI0033984C27
MELSHAARLPAPPVDIGDVVVDRPPDVPRLVPADPISRLLPVVMLIAAGGMAALYFTSGVGSRGPMMLLFPVMMAVSVLGSVAYGMRGTRRTGELNSDRRDYLCYLAAVDDAVTRTADAQHHSLWWSHPDPSALWTLVGGERMGERRPGDGDFCHVRVGLGVCRPAAALIAPDVAPAGSADPVTVDAVQRLVDARSGVAPVPVTVDLRGHRFVTVEGEPAATRALMRAMVCQLTVLHDPDEVSVVSVVDAAAARHWEWMKWLPHHQHRREADDAGSARLTYDGRLDALPSVAAENVVIVVDGGEVPADLPATGVSVLVVGTRPGGPVAVLLDGTGVDTLAVPDAMPMAAALTCARRLASRTGSGHRRSDDAPGWPDLVGIGDPCRIDPARTWQGRTAGRHLRVPIGRGDDGEPVELDLKEAAHGGMGPHGLCVGATGSGKSELLRTLALGLVATHSPDVLNLALIDFKGGATFLGFERLRHVAAVITNLADEAHLVSRMRDALSGEMNRRQEILRTAGNLANVTVYEEARAAGAPLAPLPVLLIIVDEFSELLARQPDLAEMFVAIGRVGRSLGMHLLLASQRLDEGRLRGLETHLSYRICLKTFSAAESRAVLGTADGYDLPNTPGMALLKTADGDLIRFRSSYVSAPVVGAQVRDTGESTFIPTLFTAAQVGVRRDGAHKPHAEASGASVLAVVLNGLSDAGTPAHQVWSPPLTASPSLDQVLARGGRLAPLNVPIGLVDRPFDQRSDQLIVDLAGAGGNVAVVGGPRAGKSTALRSLVLALAATHSPEAVQIYGLDFGGGTLAATRALPHVGAVAGRFESDLARRIVAQLESMVWQRESRLRRGFADAYSHVFLVIDGWATARAELDGLEESVTALAGQGLAVGVHIVVASSRWADLRPALKDRIATRIELRLGDPAESEMDRGRARGLLDRPPGRGVTREGLELVIALPRLDGVPTVMDLDDALHSAAHQLRTRHGDLMAPPVHLLPATVDLDTVTARSGAATSTRIPIGVGDDDLQPLAVEFDRQPHLIVLGESECGKTATLRTLCRAITGGLDAAAAQLMIIDPRRTLLGVVETDHLLGYAVSAAGAQPHVAELSARLRARLPGAGVTQRQLRERSWWTGPEAWVIVDDYDLIAESADGNPLLGILDLLPHAGDLGLHMVVARRSGGAARAMYDPVLARLRDLGCMGLMMSARADEGPLFGSLRPTVQPPGRGTLIRRGLGDQLVQIAWTAAPL